MLPRSSYACVMAFSALIFASCIWVSHVHALSTDFTVRTLIGEDTTPPTTPTPFSAIPITQSQINLSWGASTDDFVLSGYQVFRDSIQIATTSNTTYADIGLFASTTYTYYVTAFDSFGNISTPTPLVATSTFATPTPPIVPTTTPSSGQSYGSKARLPELVSLEVIPGERSAVIRFETEGYVRAVLRWGETYAYELGSSMERSFTQFHEMRIEDLMPGTRYLFSIEGETQKGVSGLLTERTFRTLPGEDTTPPGVITGLSAVINGSDVVLSWDAPIDADFARVRVVRSTSFFPQGDADGWVVFDGEGSRARDRDVAVPGTRMYYSVFAYDASGNVSAPAVLSLSVPAEGGEGGGSDVSEAVSSDPEKNQIRLSLNDVQFFQDGVALTHDRGTVSIRGEQHLTIAIPYTALPEHLKTILVHISPVAAPHTELSFLLRIQEDKRAYTARLAPLGVAGDFKIRISVFDYKTAQVGYVEGRITSRIVSFGEDTEEVLGTQVYVHRMILWMLLPFIVCILLVIVWRVHMWRRERADARG